MLPLFTLDRFDPTPIYEQFITQVEWHILSGTLGPQDALPSVRSLSLSLNVNPNTLQKAYTELERRGLCTSSPGSGRFVTEDARARIALHRRLQLQTLARIARELAMAGIPLTDALSSVREAYGTAVHKEEEPV